VPANLRCGRPEHDHPAPADPSWAALTYTFGGIWEITPQALEEAADTVQVVDVREPAEYTGSLGHIAQARLIPLGELERRVAELAADIPVVTVCRSGARSAQAAVILQRIGVRDVANLSGGMLRWRAEGHAVVGGQA
jgi:sulfur dioxygenase